MAAIPAFRTFGPIFSLEIAFTYTTLARTAFTVLPLVLPLDTSLY